MDRSTGRSLRSKEKLKAMLYADLWELVAEKFHCDFDFLRELNPDVSDSELGAGTILRVPDVSEFRIADVAALEKQIREQQKLTNAAADDEVMIGFLPLLRRVKTRPSLQQRP